jgi:hypothetical protein
LQPQVSAVKGKLYRLATVVQLCEFLKRWWAEYASR